MDLASLIKNFENLNLFKSPNNLFALAFIYIGVKVIQKIYKSSSQKRVLNDHIKRARKYIEERNQTLNKFYEENNSNFSEKIQHEITHSSFVQLKELLEKGKYTSEQITKIFLLRIAKEGVKNAGLADINIEETLNYARKADIIYEKIKNGEISLEESRKNYPFLGVPMTIKDNLSTKGFRTTFGYLISFDRIAKKDADIVEVMKNKGGVPLATSNVPQGLLMLESPNNIFGRSLNPFDHRRTPGGSTGGEGALVSSFCSPVGFGNDFGGSTRLPAVFCGLYNIKGTSNRISGKGVLDRSNTYIGNTAFINKPVCGHLTRTFEDLLYIASNIYGEFTQDSLCSKTKFDLPLYQSVLNKKKFRIGYFMGNDFVEKPTFPIENLMNDVIETLKNHNDIEFEFVKFDFKLMTEFHIKILKSLMSCQSISIIKNSLVFEPLVDEYSAFAKLNKIPNFLRKIAQFILKITGRRREEILVRELNPNLSLTEYFALIRRIEEIKIEFNNYYQELQLDALLTPASAHPATFHGMHPDVASLSFYSLIFNFLDYPSGVFPVRKIGKTNQKYVDRYDDKFTKALNRTLEDSENLPIGLQISTETSSDEKCYAIIKMIDQILNEKNVKEKIFD